MARLPTVPLLLTLLGAWPALAQQAPQPQESPAPEPSPPREPASAERPGRFRLGPFYITPSLRIGNIGLDTNVFYTSTDRQTDVMGSGGPGLEILLPFGQAGRFSVEGAVDYLYFVRTRSQRRLNGSARSRLEWKTHRTLAAAEGSYGRTLARAGFEVDRRVLQDTGAARAELKQRLFGRTSLHLEGVRTRYDVAEGEIFLGSDLRRTLSRDVYLGKLGLEYSLTIKTSVVVEGDHQADRFLLEPARDADSNRILAGLRTVEPALISGRALAGVRSFRPKNAPAGKEKRLAVVDVDATLNLSPKTRIGGHYARDLAYSAFSPSGKTPTLLTETYGARIDKELLRRLDLKLFGRVTRLRTDGAVSVELPQGERVVALREDTAREAGADLGYRFRPRLRIGVAVAYTERRSTISYFGIEGLLVGLTVSFTP